MRDLIRKDQDRVKLRVRLLRAAEAPMVAEMGASYFAELRARAYKHPATHSGAPHPLERPKSSN